MMQNPQSRSLSIFGTLMIICGFLAYISIGIKARNILFSGLGFGAIAWLLSWLNGIGKINVWSGIALSFASSFIFGQRTIANLLALIGIIQHSMPLDAYNKCIAIVILLFMCITSLGTLMLLFYSIPEKEV